MSNLRWIVLSLWLMASGVMGTERGVLVVRDPSGDQVGLYRESHALLVGVSDYTAGWPDLESVPGELERVARALRTQGFRVEKVLDPDAEQLERAFEDFIKAYGFDTDNRLLFYFAGHGHTRKASKGYLVPVDAPDPRRDEKGFLRKALDMSQIIAWTRRIEAKHALFLFDSCFSGTVFKARDLPARPPHITSLTGAPVRQFITAGSAGETVPAKSTFATVLVDAIEHRLADLDKDGFVTGTELGVHIQSTVPQHVSQTPQFGKHPDYELSRGDFVFAVGKPPAAPAYLTVRSNVHGDSLYIDDLAKGPTGPKAHELSAGTHRVRVEKPDYRPWKETVTLDAGERRTVRARLLADIAPVLVPIEGGCFEMGSPAGEEGRAPNERRHRVCVEAFELGPHEVTVGEFRRFVEATGYRTDAKGCVALDLEDKENEKDWRDWASWRKPNKYQPNRDDHPVACVSHKDAGAYIAWLNRETGARYRLPTEAEWEYAARAGTETARYWGERPEQACDYANVADQTPLPNGSNWGFGHECDDGHAFAAPVGHFRANDLGLYDMLGNLWEWTCSAYDEAYGGGDQQCAGKNDAARRVIRGGSCDAGPLGVRAAARIGTTPETRDTHLGFRLARTP